MKIQSEGVSKASGTIVVSVGNKRESPGVIAVFAVQTAASIDCRCVTYLSMSVSESVLESTPVAEST